MEWPTVPVENVLAQRASTVACQLQCVIRRIASHCRKSQLAFIEHVFNSQEFESDSIVLDLVLPAFFRLIVRTRTAGGRHCDSS